MKHYELMLEINVNKFSQYFSPFFYLEQIILTIQYVLCNGDEYHQVTLSNGEVCDFNLFIEQTDLISLAKLKVDPHNTPKTR